MIVLHQANLTKQQHRKRVAIALEKVIISEDVQDTRLNRPLTKKMNTWNNDILYTRSSAMWLNSLNSVILIVALKINNDLACINFFY